MDGMLILPADHTRGEGNITRRRWRNWSTISRGSFAGIGADLKALLSVARLAELHDALGPVVSAITPMTDNKRLQAKGH